MRKYNRKENIVMNTNYVILVNHLYDQNALK